MNTFDEFANIGVDQSRLFVDYPVGAVWYSSDCQVGHIFFNAVQITRQKIGIFLTPDD